MNKKLKLIIPVLLFFILSGSVEAKISPKLATSEKKYKIIVVQKGDSLWKLAKTYYNNHYYWTRFKRFNTFTNTNRLYPGEKLIVNIEDVEQVAPPVLGTASERILESNFQEEKIILEKEIERLKSEQEIKLKELQESKDNINNLILKLESSKERIVSLEAEVEDLKKSQQVSITNAKDAAPKEERIKMLLDEIQTVRSENEMTEKFVIELRKSLNEADTEIEGLKNEISQLKDKEK